MKHIYWPNYRKKLKKIKKIKKLKKNNDKDPRFKVVEHDRILKYIYIFYKSLQSKLMCVRYMK